MRKKAWMLLVLMVIVFSTIFLGSLGYTVCANKKENDDYWIFYVARVNEGYYCVVSPSSPQPPPSIPVEELRWVKRAIPKYDPFLNRTISFHEAILEIHKWEVFPYCYMTWEQVQAELNPLGSAKVYMESTVASTIATGVVGVVCSVKTLRNKKES